MQDKELSEEERADVKKVVHLLARFVLDEIEQEKKKVNDSNLIDKKAVRILASHLHGTFVWSETKEGHNYWKDVYDKLRRIAEEGF